mgnify:CR=1 FL=1
MGIRLLLNITPQSTSIAMVCKNWPQVPRAGLARQASPEKTQPSLSGFKNWKRSSSRRRSKLISGMRRYFVIIFVSFPFQMSWQQVILPYFSQLLLATGRQERRPEPSLRSPDQRSQSGTCRSPIFGFQK